MTTSEHGQMGAKYDGRNHRRISESVGELFKAKVGAKVGAKRKEGISSR